jgi:hypothetical protein
LEFWSVDVAGNIEATQSVEFAISATQVQSSLPPLALLGGRSTFDGLGLYGRQVPGWLDFSSGGAASG